MLRRHFLGSMLSLLAQDSPTFRSGVSLVRVDCEVTDGAHTLSGLGLDDFRISDNGELQVIRLVAQETEPLDLVLAFDISGSLAGSVRKVGLAARKALDHLNADDRVALITFERRIRVLLPFTSQLEEVRRTIEDRIVHGRFGGGTALLEAMDKAGNLVGKERRTLRRRAILVVTDNIGNPSRVDQNSLVKRLWAANVTVNGLIVGAYWKMRMSGATWPSHGMDRRRDMQTDIRAISEETGGALLLADDPGRGFEELMERIRRRYSVYYDMPKGKPGERRSVRVELSEAALRKTPGARVYARRDYFLPAKAELSAR